MDYYHCEIGLFTVYQHFLNTTQLMIPNTLRRQISLLVLLVSNRFDEALRTEKRSR